MPTRAPFPFATLPAPDEDHSRGEQEQTVSVVADEQYALLHSDPAAVLDDHADPTRQHLHTTRQESAIATLLERIGLPRLRPRAPCHRLTPGTIATMLRHALGELDAPNRPGTIAVLRQLGFRDAPRMSGLHPSGRHLRQDATRWR